MSINPDYQINESRYEWCVQFFSVLRSGVGMHMETFAADGLIESGQIFQFNHFTRLETIIPQYFIHQATGAFCRCVADYRLFSGNERLAKLMWSVGVVPSNHPGLLPFLAAEILRGRKVIIFPEGSMIKDHQIASAPPSIFSPSVGPSSEHKHGAAALAVILEIFKKRILSVRDEGNLPRLDRWVAALGLDGREALVAAALLPTLIVPSNITFYPLHKGDNILSKAAELFHVDLGQRGNDELLVEGNLLLRDTDMDIRFGQPIHPDVAWTDADLNMLSDSFEKIDSLDELFALKDSASQLVENLAALSIRRTSNRLRDLCMQEMYSKVTVNLSHLASRLVVRILETGATEIEKPMFHSLLYRILKEVQQQPDLYLHRSLIDPDVYDGIHNGSSALLTQFFEVATASNLIDITPSHYRLLPAIRGGDGHRDPRLENTIRVYANEIALLANVIHIIEQAVVPTGVLMAGFLFDDEMQAVAHNKLKFFQQHYTHINSAETLGANGEPFLLMPAVSGKSGVVLVHGFLSSPASLRELAESLLKAGHPVLGVRLKGHGTSPWDLRERSWNDWLFSVRRGFEIMAHLSPSVLLAGFGTGASLALQVAATQPAGLLGVVAVAAPLKFRDGYIGSAPLLDGINRLAQWAFMEDGVKPFYHFKPRYPQFEYHHKPVRAMVEIRKAAEALQHCLPQIICPVALIQATDDPIVDPQSAQLIQSQVTAMKKSLYMIPSTSHDILLENVGDTQALVVSLLDAMAAPLPKITPLPIGFMKKMVGLLAGISTKFFQRHAKK